MQPTISFGILVCNEHVELDNLLNRLTECIKGTQHEIIIVADLDNTTQEVYDIVDKYINKTYNTGIPYLIELYKRSLNRDFAAQRNYLNSLCNGDYIFQIDSDEMIDKEFIEYLPIILEANSNVDVYNIARINIVNHLELDDVVRWGWHITKNDNYIATSNYDDLYPKEYELLKVYELIINERLDDATVTYYRPIVNFPDYQRRLFKNKPNIRWKNLVHETLEGYETHSDLVKDDMFCLKHIKSIERQRSQNNFYNQIN